MFIYLTESLELDTLFSYPPTTLHLLHLQFTYNQLDIDTDGVIWRYWLYLYALDIL
jgi:hypothetical protein